jgi:hypothetical protein
MINKSGLLMMSLLVMILSVNSVLAIDISVSKTAISDVIISDFNQPAKFNLAITNNGADDYFTIYSLVGVRITPEDSIFIARGQTKEVLISVYPNRDLKSDTGSLVFVYKIKGDKSGVKEDTLTLNIVQLEDAFTIGTYPIDPESESATVYFRNNYNIAYDSVKASFSSVFFTFSEEFPLSPFQRREFPTPVDKSEISTLSAGQYILKTQLEIDGIKKTVENNIRFSEKSFIKTSEENYGWAVNKQVIAKTNEGNLESMADVVVKKNIISRLFTTFNLEPYKVQREGFSVVYYWQKELKPGESFTVRVTTNWLIPLLIIVAAVVLSFFINLYRRSHVIVRKRVTFVRAKGGQLGLKVSLLVRGRGFVERVKVYDRIPAIAKLYERFGAIQPTRFDHATRRLEWNLGNLDRGEERVLSYIIYSRVGVVGKFELPRATAVYEKDNRIFESDSNRAFFITEPKGTEEF